MGSIPFFSIHHQQQQLSFDCLASFFLLEQKKAKPVKMVLEDYTYVFALGTMFALLEAYNNGANDVANAWATSVSSRSVTYRQAMILCLVFEMTGALAVGARTASTI